MLPRILALLAAMALALWVILLRRWRAAAGGEFEKLLVELSRALNVPERIDLKDLYRRRTLLYANKRSLEGQMSRKSDEATQRAYQAVIDQNDRNVAAVEERLPRLEQLRQRMIAHELLTAFSAALLALAVYVLVASRGA